MKKTHLLLSLAIGAAMPLGLASATGAAAATHHMITVEADLPAVNDDGEPDTHSGLSVPCTSALGPTPCEILPTFSIAEDVTVAGVTVAEVGAESGPIDSDG